MRRLAAGVVAAIALAGCVTYRPVPLRDGAFPRGALQVGDDVRVQTRTGDTLSFEVVSLEGGTLTGSSGQSVAPGDLADLEVAHVNKRATFITLGVVGGVIGIAIVNDAVDCLLDFTCDD